MTCSPGGSLTGRAAQSADVLAGARVFSLINGKFARHVSLGRHQPWGARIVPRFT